MKNNKVFLLSMTGFLLVGIIVLIVGFALSGADIISFLSSTYAIWCYVALGIWLIVLVIFLIQDKIKKL